MTDFTIEIHWQCSSLENHTANVGGYQQWGLYDERQYPQCSCPAYKFGKRTIVFGGHYYPSTCKHIEQAEKSACGWQSLISPEEMTERGVCPRCGSKAVPVKVAV